MNLLEVGLYTVSYIRNGNDKNGNPVYLINVFQDISDDGIKKYYNVNYSSTRKLDKNGNIRVISYSINNTIATILNDIK